MEEVCVRIEDDGTLKVGMEPAAEEGAEGGAEGIPGLEMAGAKDDSYLQPVASIDELLAKVRELVMQAQGGEAPQDPAMAQQDFEAGFKGQRGEM